MIIYPHRYIYCSVLCIYIYSSFDKKKVHGILFVDILRPNNVWKSSFAAAVRKFSKLQFGIEPFDVYLLCYVLYNYNSVVVYRVFLFR